MTKIGLLETVFLAQKKLGRRANPDKEKPFYCPSMFFEINGKLEPIHEPFFMGFLEGIRFTYENSKTLRGNY